MSTSWPESGPEISRADLVMHALTGPVAGLEDRSVLGVIEREGDRPIGKVLAPPAMRLLVSVRVSSGSTARLISTLSSPRFSSPTAAFLIIPPALSRRNRELGVAVGLPGNLDLIRGGRGFFPGPARFNLRRPAGLVRGPGRWARRRLGHPRPAPRRERAPARDAYSYEQELPD